MNYKKYLLVAFLLGSSCFCGHAQDISQVDMKHPVKLSGGVNLQLQSYSATGIPPREQAFTWMMNGNPTITVLGVALPFSFLFSNFQNRYYQPFNQFGVSPYYKWVKVHLGYRNVQFSQFTLAGYRMLGAGVELTPKGFRFGFMYGQLNRSTTIDSLQNANPLAFRPLPSYTRMAYAVKIGVGTEKNYFDVSFLKGWDVAGSLNSQLQDSVAPQENKVIGLSWKKTFFKNFMWKTDLGLSIYTLDTRATPYSDVANSFFTDKFIADFVKPTISTQYLLAGETRLGYHGRIVGADVIYRRVDPDYKSMGAYFFQTDIEQYSIAPYAHLDSGKLTITGTGGIQHDNLYNLKTATSQNVIASANVSFNPSSKFGLNANYSNYGITQNPTRISPQSDLFKQVSDNYSLTPYVNFISPHSANNVVLVACYEQLTAPTASINSTPNQNTMVGSLSYTHTWLPRGISANISANYNNTALSGQGNIGSYGAGAGVGAVLFKKVSISANAMYNSNYFNSADNGYTLLTSLSCTIPVMKKQTLQLYGSYLGNNSKNTTVVQTFSEYTFRINYGFTF